MQRRTSRLSTLGAVVLVASLALLATPQAATAGVTPDRHGGFRFKSVEIPIQFDQWLYQEVAPGSDAGFESPTYDDSDWPTGAAAFGNDHKPGCAYNSPKLVRTPWTSGTDLLMRAQFYVPGDPLYISSVRLQGTITPSADIYVNGVLQAHVDADGCSRRNIDVPLGDYDIDSPSTLAIRATGTGKTLYADVKLTLYGGEDCDCFVATH